MIPIWKDTYFTGVTPNLNFMVRLDGGKIYESTLGRMPNGGELDFRINKVCESYLNTNLPDFRNITDSTILHNNATREAVLYVKNNGTETYTELARWNLINDWSYEDFINENKPLSEPINGHLDSRMKLFYTVYRNNSGNICYEYEG